MKLGYARVSKECQNLDLQVDALKNAGCEQIFTDTASGAKSDRPGLNDLFKFLREGDTLVVWKLDRLGRNLRHLIEIVKLIEERKACFTSIQENMDTTNAMGKMIFHFFGAMAEFERAMIVERTHAGLVAAKARGRPGGRRFKLDKYQIKRLKQLYDQKNNSLEELSSMFNITKPSIYNYLKLHEKNN